MDMAQHYLMGQALYSCLTLVREAPTTPILQIMFVRAVQTQFVLEEKADMFTWKKTFADVIQLFIGFGLPSQAIATKILACHSPFHIQI